MIRTIPKKFCKYKKSKNLEIHGTQSHMGYHDEGGIWITVPGNNNFRFDIGKREDLKNLKEVIDFVLKRKPQTKEEYNKMIFGSKNINISIEKSEDEEIKKEEENG